MRLSIAAACALGLAATSATAGGMAEPVMEMAPVVVVEDAQGSSTSAGLIIPLILIALIAAAASSSDGNGGEQTSELSDARLKTDIVQVGTTADGLPLYHFRYIGQSQVWEGVMAQDVLAHRPDAVITGSHGIMSVDYGALGLTMTPVE